MLTVRSSLVNNSVLSLNGLPDQFFKTRNEQKTALGVGKKLSSEFTEALPYSLSEESQTDSTSRHLGDINFAFQFVFLSTGLEFYMMVLCFYLIFISLNR